MMRYPINKLLVAAFAMLCAQATFTSAARAQGVPPAIGDAVTEGAQIEDALRDVQVQSAANREGEVIDGEGGVFLLRKVDIFSIGADADFAYQSNPARTDAAGNSGSFRWYGFGFRGRCHASRQPLQRGA